MKRFGSVALAVVTFVLVLIQLPIIKIEIPVPSAKIVPNSGFSYLFAPVQFNEHGLYLPSDGTMADNLSSLSLFEDGKPLGPPHELHELIRKTGRGGFSHWYDQLVFSSSDNTDPRVNGRIYKATGVLRIAEPWRTWTLAALALSLAGMISIYARAWIAPLKRALTWRSLLSLAKLAAVAALFAISWRPYLTVATTDQWLTTAIRDLGAFWSSGQAFRWAFCIAVLAITTLGPCVTPFIADGKLRLPLAFLIVIAFLADAIVLNIAGQNLTLDMVDTLWRERNVDADTFAGYGGAIARLGALSTGLFAILAWPPNWSVGRKFAIVPVAALIAPFAMIYATHGATTASAPGVSVPAQLAFVNLAGARISELREPVSYPGTPQPRFRKIVFIVDESVRGDYLSLNNPKLDNTPSLVALNPYMANFGTATSGSNCSASARLFLRIGIMPSELPDVAQVWSRKTTMWAYAKAAGFRTVLVDAHSPPAPLFHSYMDLSEAKLIDEIKQVRDLPTYNRDHQLPAVLLDLLSRDEPMFIAVNKWGVHAHFIDRMPRDFHYQTEKSPIDPNLSAAHGEIVSQYDRALKWSIDRFFELLGPNIVRDDTLVLYTSDHGQALFDGGYENQHCSLGNRIANGEALVPLFAITREQRILKDWQNAAFRFKDRASHFEIFPTLLYSMGYDKSWIDRKYGPTLLDVPENRQRGFLMGTFYHRSAKWLTLGRDGFTSREN